MVCDQVGPWWVFISVLMNVFCVGSGQLDPDYQVKCILDSTHRVTVEVNSGCQAGAQVFIDGCTVKRICASAALANFATNTETECDPDLDPNGDNVFQFRLFALATPDVLYDPTTDVAYTGSCTVSGPGEALATLVKITSFPAYSAAPVGTLTDVIEPDITMDITKDGNPVTTTTVGDDLVLTIRVDQVYIDDYNFDIAIDKMDVNYIRLMTNGCPTTTFVPAFVDTALGVQTVSFKSFMDPARQQSSQFIATVDICIGPCTNPTCTKKKRREVSDTIGSLNESTRRRTLRTQVKVIPHSQYRVISSGKALKPIITSQPNQTMTSQDKQAEEERFHVTDDVDGSLTTVLLVVATVTIVLLFGVIVGIAIYMKNAVMSK